MAHHLILVCEAQGSAPKRGCFPRDEPPEANALAHAADVAARLGRVDRAWCGPHAAGRQTATALGLAVEPDPALACPDHGQWTGLPIRAVIAEYPRQFADWMQGAAPPDGESRDALRVRARDWIATLDGLRGRSAAVAPAAMIRAIVLEVLEAPQTAFSRLDIDPLSTSLLTHDGTRWALRSLGCAAISGLRHRSDPCDNS